MTQDMLPIARDTPRSAADSVKRRAVVSVAALLTLTAVAGAVPPRAFASARPASEVIPTNAATVNIQVTNALPDDPSGQPLTDPFDVGAHSRVARLAVIFNRLPLAPPPREGPPFIGYPQDFWITLTFRSATGKTLAVVTLAKNKFPVHVTIDGQHEPNLAWGSQRVYAQVDSVLDNRLSRIRAFPPS